MYITLLQHNLTEHTEDLWLAVCLHGCLAACTPACLPGWLALLACGITTNIGTRVKFPNTPLDRKVVIGTMERARAFSLGRPEKLLRWSSIPSPVSLLNSPVSPSWSQLVVTDLFSSLSVPRVVSNSDGNTQGPDQKKSYMSQAHCPWKSTRRCQTQTRSTRFWITRVELENMHAIYPWSPRRSIQGSAVRDSHGNARASPHSANHHFSILGGDGADTHLLLPLLLLSCTAACTPAWLPARLPA